MKLKFTLGYLFLLLVSVPFVQANVVVLDTDLELRGGDEWTASLYVERGDLNVAVKGSQDLLNFTLYQNNNTVLSMVIIADESTNVTIPVSNGEIIVYVSTSPSSLVPSYIEILMTQDDRPVNGLIVISGIVLFLAIPVTYIFGKNQGLQKL